jgi:hypothetical protein
MRERERARVRVVFLTLKRVARKVVNHIVIDAREPLSTTTNTNYKSLNRSHPSLHTDNKKITQQLRPETGSRKKERNANLEPLYECASGCSYRL